MHAVPRPVAGHADALVSAKRTPRGMRNRGYDRRASSRCGAGHSHRRPRSDRAGLSQNERGSSDHSAGTTGQMTITRRVCRCDVMKFIMERNDAAPTARPAELSSPRGHFTETRTHLPHHSPPAILYHFHRYAPDSNRRALSPSGLDNIFLRITGAARRCRRCSSPSARLPPRFRRVAWSCISARGNPVLLPEGPRGLIPHSK